MNEQLIIEDALGQLKAHTGIKAIIDRDHPREIDGKIHFTYNGRKHIAFIEAKKQVRPHQLPNLTKLKAKFHPLMVVTEYLYPKMKEELRKENIAYLETNGNIYYKDKDLFLWLDGQKAAIEPKEKTGRAFTKTGLKLLFHFLLHPELLDLTYREMANKTGVMFGNINVIVQDLKQQGFLVQLDKQRMALNNKKELLQRWMIAYDEKLKPAMKLGTFRFLKEEDFINWKKVPILPMKTWWGGEPAADLFTHYLKPGELTMYTLETRQDLIRHYRLVPDERGNVKIFQKFWHDDDVKNNIVPPLLVYVDLMNTGDRRCMETAQIIYDKFLQDEF